MRSLAAPDTSQTLSRGARPHVSGKFVFVGDEKFWVRGVTYGPLRAAVHGNEYDDPAAVDRDFASMAANGINAVRTYTVPPRWLLDVAHRHGLRVMVGLPWEQHVAFLEEAERADRIQAAVRAGVRACAGHPAVLAYAIGNEIPAPIVRWYGARRVERFLTCLYETVKSEHPTALVTYVNYPSTEYLRLPSVDFVCFNVYLERQDRLAAYLARLQNLVGDRPLVVAELGLDSRRHGEETQAHVIDWQLRTAFGAGCAGAFVFAWTDQWHRGGYDIEDWDFGLTDRQRQPKAALAAARAAFAEAPLPRDAAWPQVSVVVCTYNGEGTIRDCLDGLLALDYPSYEIIVVDDGSVDGTASIVAEYQTLLDEADSWQPGSTPMEHDGPTENTVSERRDQSRLPLGVDDRTPCAASDGRPRLRLIRTPNRGLSSARNTGLAAARGEIVVYTDDDAYPDPHWLTYLAWVFMTTDYAGVGGPNLPPAGDGPIAECVANAPGSPIHVLLSDSEAEHIPGCNMAFRKACLQTIGGFDSRFRTAGDDVDVCWRIQEAGWRIGFSPAAVVWHHRRNSVRTYWKQQQGYGRAEALLEQKWPEKYNRVGHLSWGGRLYGPGVIQLLRWSKDRIYHGAWGSGLFQSVYQPAPSLFSALPLMPEWYLVILALAVLATLGVGWPPLLLALPLSIGAVAASVVQAVLTARSGSFRTRDRGARRRRVALTAGLCLLQPLARLDGRLRHGLSPWRRRMARGGALPHPRTTSLWRETWRSPHQTLEALERHLRSAHSVVIRGGDFDRWDLEVRSGVFGAARVRLALEEHGAGRQLQRFRSWPHCWPLGLAAALGLCALAGGAAVAQAWGVTAVLGGAATLLAVRTAQDCAHAMALLDRALASLATADHSSEELPESLEVAAATPAAGRTLAGAAAGQRPAAAGAGTRSRDYGVPDAAVRPLRLLEPANLAQEPIVRPVRRS